MTAGLTPTAFAEALRQRLALERWPLPPTALPADAALVGGAIRDAALGRLDERPDLDLVVPADAVSLAQTLARRAGGSCVVLDAERDIARLVLGGWTIDLARREGPDLTRDLLRRDYTVNALALPLAPGHTVVDPTGGLKHLEQRQLVAISEANLLDDPLRLLRGVRLAAELEFALTADSLGWIQHHGPALANVAGERVLAELEKLALAPAGQRGLGLALEFQLLAPWGATPATGLEEALLSPNSGEARGMDPQELAAALPVARLAWLLDGKAIAQLKGSRRLQQRCSGLRHWWHLLAGLSLEALPEPERLALHEQLGADLPAWLLGRPVAEAREALKRWRDPADPLFHPHAPVDGRLLQQALGLKPGPGLGRLLLHLKREQAFRRLPRTDTAAALACARDWLAAEPPAP